MSIHNISETCEVPVLETVRRATLDDLNCWEVLCCLFETLLLFAVTFLDFSSFLLIHYCYGVNI